MNRNAARTVTYASLALLVALTGSADARSSRFRAKMHASLAQDGITSNEIADGTVGCDDLSPEVRPASCPASDGTGDADSAGARNVFVDGFTQTNKEMPSTPSGNDPNASIAKLEVGEGSQIILASIVWSANPLDFSGIVTCHLVPPNGPNSKAEFIGEGTTTGTLFVQTTNEGPGVVDFRCSDQLEGSSVSYRFLQLTAIPVPSLTRTQLP
jgi:hypothetical protein